jgi:hypothetical protein
MKSAVFALVFACVPAMLLAQSTSEPRVQVGLFSHRLDGSFAAAAFDDGPELDSTLSVHDCSTGAGTGERQIPDATDIWRFTGKVLSADNERAVVQLNWRRMLAQGKKTSGNEASVQLTVRNGQSVTLDQPGPSCPTMNITFEVRYGPRPFDGIRTSGVTAPMSGIVRGSISKRSELPGSTGVTGSAPDPAASPEAVPSKRTFNVDLWIVHAIPGQADQAIHPQLRINENGGQFSLAPLRVKTATGVSTVEISGSLQVVVANGSEERLVFRTARRVTPAAVGAAAADPAHDIVGTSTVVNRLPGPDDVVSYEMPPIQIGSETLPDRFSIRVKIVPR